LPDFYGTWIFSIDFRKNQNQNFANIRPLAGGLFHEYGQTCLPQLPVALRGIANGSKNHSRYRTVPRDS
jgi:hypothetical protein